MRPPGTGAAVHERTVSRRTVPATMPPVTMRPATMPPATMRPATMRPATMRRIDLQIVRWRRRAQAPAPARPTAVPYRGISPDGDPRTSAQEQRPPDTLLPCAARRSHAPGAHLPPRSGAEKRARWLLDDPTATPQSRSSMVVWPRAGADARPFPRRSEDRSYGRSHSRSMLAGC